MCTYVYIHIMTCYATKDAVRIGNPFYYKILARNYNYSQIFPTLC
jgi:hypothetical protein